MEKNERPIIEKYDKDTLREKILDILDEIAEGRSQVNFDSVATRENIASVLVSEL